MRILLLTQVAPYPPDAGPKVKTYYLLRKLSEIYDVDLVTFVRNEHERRAVEALQSLCSSTTMVPLHRSRYREPYYAGKGWTTGTPFLVARDYRAKMATAVRERLLSGKIDVVHADQLSMAQYLPSRSIDRRRIRTVFDAHNAVWKLVRSLVDSQPTPAHRLAATIEWRLLRRFEGGACANADLTLAVSDIDAGHLQEAAATPVNFAIAPIGIEARETEHFAIGAANRRLLSVATMHYPPNADAIRWFRDQVWPQLNEDERRVGLDIVGSRPPEDLQRWAEFDQHVKVHGYVADLSRLYQEAAVFIVPLHAGSGIRVKVLEAMARGLPIVSTSVGVEGLPVRTGENLMIADDAGAFAAAIRELLHSPERRRAMAVAARKFALLYDWRVCLEPVVEAYSRLDESAAPVRSLDIDPQLRLQDRQSN